MVLFLLFFLFSYDLPPFLATFVFVLLLADASPFLLDFFLVAIISRSFMYILLLMIYLIGIIGKELREVSEVSLYDIELDNFLIAAKYATFGFLARKKR
jgi:hypothetical protein